MYPRTIIKLVLVLCFHAILLTSSYAQGWQKSLASNDTEHFTSNLVTASGDFVFVGTKQTRNPNSWSVYIVKTDPQGNILWEKGHQNPPNSISPTAIIETSNGGFAITGTTYNTNADIFLMLIDVNGDLITIKSYDNSTYDIGRDIIEIADGGFAIAAETLISSTDFRDFYLIKTDALGNVEWSNTYGTSIMDIPVGIHQLSGGDYILGGTSRTNQGIQTTYITRVATNGNLVWEKEIASASYNTTALTANDELMLAGTSSLSSLGNILTKLDADGNVIWTREITDSPAILGRSSDIAITGSTGFVISGSIYLNNTVYVEKAYMIKVDPNGQHLWTQLYGLAREERLNTVAVAANGDLVAAGSSLFLNPDNSLRFDAYMLKTDGDGNLATNFIQGQLQQDINLDCLLDAGDVNAADRVIMAKSKNDPSKIFFDWADADGNFEIAADLDTYELLPFSAYGTRWGFCTPFEVDLSSASNNVGPRLGRLYPWLPTNLTSCGQLILDTSGNCMEEAGEPALAGWKIIAKSSYSGLFETTTDADGNYELLLNPWDGYKVYAMPMQPGNWAFCTDTLIVDSTTVDAMGKKSHNFLVHPGDPPGTINGQVYKDENIDCQNNGSEQGLSAIEIAVTAFGSTDTSFQMTDNMGNYSFDFLPGGDYEVMVFYNSNLWLPCQSPQTATVISEMTTEVDFGMQTQSLCPELQVDVSTPLLRNCEENTYYIQYCNNGDGIAFDAFLELEFDPDLMVISASVPFTTVASNTLSFDLGDIDPGECNNFSLVAFLNCYAQVGLTHCVEAHIFPDSLCGPTDSQWEGSSLSVNAVCENDSIFFNIKNVGEQDMQQENGYIVIEDNVLIRSGVIILPAGEDTTLIGLPSGATLRMEVEQSIAHPGMSFPSVAVEGCGTNASGNISLGYVTQYPEDDADPFISIDCQESIASYDPNIKRGYPKGITDEHYITANSDIEYHIHFQNTGTDTAFLVVLEDTLSALLDPASLQLGVSSHPYTFELIGGNVARFTFANILLPDSTTNTAASMGFVKFRITQQADNPPGSEIHNSAAIYFDNNPAIITNTTVHRIPQPISQSTIDLAICEGDYYGDMLVIADTTIVDSIDYHYFNEVMITQIASLLGASNYIDTSLQSGGVFHGNTYFQDTTITEIYAAANGCDSVLTVEIMINALGLPILKAESVNLIVYPNPAKEAFFAEFELLDGQELVSIELLNGLGQLVKQPLSQTTLNQGHYRILIGRNGLPSGTYLLRLRTAEGSIYKQLVII